MKIKFTKMNGCGNDFIIIDNTKKQIEEKLLNDFAKKACKRKRSLGADGVLVLESSKKFSFKMRLFNRDGSEGEMCGNGARCIARYAYLKGIADKKMSFETLAGRIDAEVRQDETGIKLPKVFFKDIKKGKITVDDKPLEYYSLILGVPHCVIFLEKSLSENELFDLGKKIRFNKHHFPKGTNVNFSEFKENSEIFVTTYERGVEQITLACGTGSSACALVSAYSGKTTPPVTVNTKGGRLKIRFNKDKKGFNNIFLFGDANLIAEGVLYV